MPVETTAGEDINAADMEPAPTFELPAEPVIEVDEAAVAQVQQAQGEIAAATTPDSYFEAVAAAPPSVKAQAEPTLESDMARLAQGEETEYQASIPDFEARMGGGEDIPEPTPVAPPGGQAQALEANTPQALAPADEGRLPAPEPYTANNSVVGMLRRLFGLGDAGSVGQSLAAVNTRDNVNTDPGTPPPVPLEGEADPQRVENQAQAASQQARDKRDDATRQVMTGRGPEEVQAQPLQETMAVPELAQAEFEGTAAASEGAAEFREKTLDPEVVALFDAEHGPAMESSLSQARVELDTATNARDQDRQAEIETAESETERLNNEADQAQRQQIIESRNEIQGLRQTAVNDQAQAANELESQANSERLQADGRINERVAGENQRIAERYERAEADAQSEVREGERQAEARKAEAQRDAQNRSWWDRAVDWVSDQFNKLTAAINRVFDAVRARIKGFIDAAKQFAERVIDAAANFVKRAIRGFGEFLKSAVDTLLGDTFPGIARVLNAGIDYAVEKAEAAVDRVAAGLKAGINALLDTLGRALDAILAVFQAAVNAVLAIARAAISGDWSAVARMILEPILKALGIEPQAFYAFFGQVAEVIGKIIDAPGVFLRNLLDGVMGGFSRFGENLLTHLQAGIIGWLTGALGGGITLPARWDLMGVLDLVGQILGLSVEMLRRVAVRILGEAAVEKIEFFIEFAAELIRGGWRAFFDKIKESLTNLKDMILEQIKGFLFERIITAAVTWLISLFNPVGALIKIVMTIWNLIMFLKDQLMRIIEVVRTVVQLIVDIANRVLEPVITGVEGVLARLLPIAIDLLARLLGLGNVAGRVRRIIGDVRQAIEDAIVRLIRRVVARFTGGRGRGSAGSRDDADDRAGGRSSIMAPITVRGGGESHTLFIKTIANDATPMMRSEEQSVQAWLNTLKQRTVVEGILKAKNAQASNDDIQAVFDDLQPLVQRALTEETQLENEADDAARAPSTGSASSGSAQTRSTGADPEATREAQQLAAVMRQILEKLGLVDEAGLAGKFENDINKMHDDAAANFRRYILPKMEQSPNVYGRMEWNGVRQTLPADSASLTGSWKKPASSDGVLRTRTNSEFDAAVFAIAADTAKNIPQDEGGVTEGFLNKEDDQKEFMGNYLSEKLNKSSEAAKLIRLVLGSKPSSWKQALNDVKPSIDNAVKAYLGKEAKPQPDYDIAQKIKGSTYKTLFEKPGQLAAANYTYYREQAEDGKPKEGSATEKHDLAWFLDPGGHTPRHGQNRSKVANAVRGANPGQHEWILSSMAFAAIRATIASVENRGTAGGVEGIANFLQFQHEVRTPTSKLIFDPKWAGVSTPIQFFSPAHYQRITTNKPADLTEEYKGLPAPGTPAKALQAHAGGLSAFQPKGSGVDRYPLQQVSPRWHSDLKQEISSEISDDSYLELKSIDELGQSILDYFKKTVLGSPETIGNVSLLGSGSQAFNLYYVTHGSDGKPKSLADMKKLAEDAYEDTFKDLEAKINKVVGA